MSSSFIFRPHIYDGNTVTTPDVLIDNVYVANSRDQNINISRITNDRLSTSPEIQVLGFETIADAAVLLIAAGAGMLIGVASNHRYFDQEDPQLFSKPVSRQVFRFQNISEYWENLLLKLSCEKGEVIQMGKLSEFAPVYEIISMISLGDTKLEKGTAVLCVGLPMPKYKKSASRYNIQMLSQEEGNKLELNYQVHQIK